MEPETQPSVTPRAEPWSVETRRWIILGAVALIAFLLYQLSEILPPLVLALLVAYLLNPLVVWVQQRTRLARPLATATIYLALIVLVFGVGVELVPIFARQVRAVIADFDQLLARANGLLAQLPFLDVFEIRADSNFLAGQLRAELRTLASAAPRIVAGAASGALSAVLVLVLSFYLLVDAERIARNIDNAFPPEYRDEWRAIKAEFNKIWSSFLRGQVILALVIGVLVTLTLVALGVPNALLLGLLAGVLEVVPNLGPVLAMIPAVLIALLQGSTRWALEPPVFALIVVAAYFVIQQLENHLIVPKIIGESVDLPPVVILIGAFAGASLAGVLGVFLAAPLLATARVIAKFLLRKLLEPLPGRG